MWQSDERKLAVLQISYRDLLLSALQECAKGRWGLFGQNDLAFKNARMQSRRADPAIVELLDLGEEIERLRPVLGYSDPFPLPTAY